MKAAIFDMDGTLVDSMQEWLHTSLRYLERLGIQPPPDLLDKVVTLSMAETIAYLQTLGVPGSSDEIQNRLNDLMAEAYQLHVTEKPGSLAFIHQLAEKGVRLCVLTATDRPLAEIVLARLGIKDCFSFLLSCGETGTTKRDPAIFELTLQKLDCRCEDVVVFEDALYAIRTAKQAGLRVVAISDLSSRADEVEIRMLADQFISHYEECDLRALS